MAVSGICDNQVYKTRVRPVFADTLPAGFLIVSPGYRFERRNQLNLQVPAKIRWAMDNRIHEPPNPFLCITKVWIVVSFGGFSGNTDFENNHTKKTLPHHET